MTLVDDHMPIAADEIVDLIPVDETLDHRDVKGTVRIALAASDAANPLLVDAEEHRQLCDPLLEQWLAVDHDQRAAGALGNEEGSEHRLSDSGWSDEHSGVVREERLSRVTLRVGQVAVELDFQGRTELPLVLDLQCDLVLAE